MKSPIYLDYNATAPLHPAARTAMLAVMDVPHNASSVHGFGRAAKKILEDARGALAEAVSAFPNEIIFTASATEANNWVLRAFPERRALVSAIEHPSVLKACPQAEIIPVTTDGVVDLAAFSDMISRDSRPALVSVMLANNETGVIQPIAEIAAIARSHGALLHTDAVQALGKMPVDFSLLGADMLTLSGHKMGGPVGAAALVVRQNMPIAPLFLGGGQELRRRAGTENIPAIAGFAAAVKHMPGRAEWERWAMWRDAMETQMLAAAPDAVIFGKNAPRLSNTSCVAMPGASQEIQLMAFDIAGFAISAGSACSSGRVEPSPVLRAMGAAPDMAGNAIRVSFGWASAEAELQAFTARWVAEYQRKNASK